MHGRRFFGLVATLGVLALAGCKSEVTVGGGANASGTPGAGASAGSSADHDRQPPAASIFEGFDAAAELKALQGQWKVKERRGRKNTWKIEGSKLTKTTEAGETSAHELEIAGPGHLAIKDGSSTTYLHYLVNGDKVYIGRGKAGKKVGDTWWIATMSGAVAYDGETCKWFAQKRGAARSWAAPVAIECAMSDEGGKPWLAYQTAKFGKQGEWDDFKIKVVGETGLATTQLTSNPAEKLL